MQVHLWLALILCLPMVIIGISGSGLLLQRELLVRSVPAATATGQRHTIPEIVAAAAKAAPATMAANRVERARAQGSPAVVRFHPKNGTGAEFDYYIDPVSLRILGNQEVVERGPVLAFLITIHAFLAMPPPIGLPFVGFNGAIITLMALSGLVLWWPRKGQWRNAFTMRRGTRGIAFHYDLHRVAGIWTFLVLLAVSVSGIYLTFPETLAPIIRAHLPGGDSPTTNPQVGFVPGSGPLTPEKAIALAEAAVPAARAINVALPGEEPSYVVELEPQNLQPSEPHVQVVMDAKTSAITYIDDPRNYSFPEQVLNWQHLFHFGVGLGLLWTILVFISGLLPLLFAVTGITVWWKKRQAGKARAAASVFIAEENEARVEPT
jgi:uncharacterized iron-regulated membrane protein